MIFVILGNILERLVPLQMYQCPIRGSGDFILNTMLPGWCFGRGLKTYLLNYWSRITCDTEEETARCAAGKVSVCCPGKYMDNCGI